MPAARFGQVARGVVLQQHHVADQPRSGMATLEQVVAEYAVLRQAAAEDLLEGIHVVDALADVRTFSKSVLVDVRHRPGVGIHARLAREDAGVPRPPGTGQADVDAGLQDAVPLDHSSPAGVVTRPVERVSQCAGQETGCPAGQLSVGVQGDHKLDPGQALETTGNRAEPLAPLAAEEGVELGQFAALAFPAHPDAFPRIPQPRSMKKEEAVRLVGWVLAVEGLDSGLGQGDELPVPRQGLLGCIRQVGEQGEMKVRITVGQEAHLERFQEVVDRAGGGQHGGYDHHRAALRGDAIQELDLRQRPRGDQQADQPVHRGHAQVSGAQQRRHAQQQHRPGLQAVLGRSEQDGRGQHCRRGEDGPCVAHQRAVAGHPLDKHAQ